MLMLFDGDLATRETFRFLEEKLGVGSWSYDPITGQSEWSWGCYRLLGIEPYSVEPSYEEYQNRMHPDDRSPEDKISLAQGLSLVRDFRVILPNRTLRRIHSRSEALYNADGELTKIAGLMLDVTNHHETIRQLKVYKDRFDGLAQAVEAAEAVIWTASAGGRITEIHNWTDFREELFGDGWLDFVHVEDRPAMLTSRSTALKSGQTYCVEHRMLQPDGEYRWVGSWAVPIFNQDRVAQEWIGLSLDVHEKKLSAFATPAPSGLTGAQMRAARGILNWSVKELAARTSISPAVIRRLEEYDGTPPLSDDSMEVIQKTFSDAGIEFLFPQLGKPGLRPR